MHPVTARQFRELLCCHEIHPTVARRCGPQGAACTLEPEATQAEKVTGGVSVSALLRVVEKPEIRRSTLRSL